MVDPHRAAAGDAGGARLRIPDPRDDPRAGAGGRLGAYRVGAHRRGRHVRWYPAQRSHAADDRRRAGRDAPQDRDLDAPLPAVYRGDRDPQVRQPDPGGGAADVADRQDRDQLQAGRRADLDQRPAARDHARDRGRHRHRRDVDDRAPAQGLRKARGPAAMGHRRHRVRRLHVRTLRLAARRAAGRVPGWLILVPPSSHRCILAADQARTGASGDRRRTRMSCVKTSVLLALAIVSLLPATGWADEEHTPDDASAVVQKYLAARVKKEGAFRFKDAQADAQLELVQDEIRVARGIHGYGFFVCVQFHTKADAKKPYDIDFWLKEDSLDIVDVRIHKAPKRDVY